MGGLGVDAVADHEGVEQDEHAEQAVRLPVGVLGVIGARPSVAFGAGPVGAVQFYPDAVAGVQTTFPLASWPAPSVHL